MVMSLITMILTISTGVILFSTVAPFMILSTDHTMAMVMATGHGEVGGPYPSGLAIPGDGEVDGIPVFQ